MITLIVTEMIDIEGLDLNIGMTILMTTLIIDTERANLSIVIMIVMMMSVKLEGTEAIKAGLKIVSKLKNLGKEIKEGKA